MIMDNIKSLFRKTCTNALPSYEISKEGERVPRLYRREDFTQFAKEAFERGDSFFYAEPVNPDRPNGAHRLCEPKYVYELKHALSEEEYSRYFSSQKLTIATPKGTLEAGICGDFNYPGIYVDLVPEGVDYPVTIALVEHNDLCDNIKTFVYGDAMSEEFTQSVELENLEHYVELTGREESADVESEL